MNIGQFDQYREAVKDLSSLLRTYYEELLSKGFTPEQALLMVIELQKYCLTAGGK